MSKSKVAPSNRLEGRPKTGHPPDGISFALCRATDGKALDQNARSRTVGVGQSGVSMALTRKS
jgi:hypothetical protein